MFSQKRDSFCMNSEHVLVSSQFLFPQSLPFSTTYFTDSRDFQFIPSIRIFEQLLFWSHFSHSLMVVSGFIAVLCKLIVIGLAIRIFESNSFAVVHYISLNCDEHVLI